MMVASSWITQFVATAMMAVLPVMVNTNDGKKAEGNLKGFTSDTLLLDQSGAEIKYSFLDLSSLEPVDVEERTGPSTQVNLISGSRILAQELRMDDDGLTIEPRRQNPLQVPIKQVKSIRFRQPAVGTDSQWLGILDRQGRGDTLVIRRPDDRLDPQQGIVISMTRETVGFSIDGTKIDAPVDRLEGLVFGGNEAVTEDAAIQVVDVYGSRWAVTDLQPSDGEQPLQMELGGNVKHQIPVHQIFSMRWSGGMTLLATEKPAATKFESYLASNADNQLLTSFFGPAVVGEHDLVMNGGSSIEYRVDPGFRRIAGSVVRNSTSGQVSKVTVRVLLDGKTVWEEPLKDSEPRGFELPINAARRVTLEVDSGDDGNLGDTVRISRPRLVK
jgi:hypothetical protein